jgi:hypothetical protein
MGRIIRGHWRSLGRIRLAGALICVLVGSGVTAAVTTAAVAKSKLLWDSTACGGPPSSPNVECMTFAPYGANSAVVTFSVGPLRKLPVSQRYKISSFTFWTVDKALSVLPHGICKAHGTASEAPTDPKYHVTKCDVTIAAGSSIQLCVTEAGTASAGPVGRVFQWAARLTTGGSVENVASPVAAVSRCPASVTHK